MDFFESNNILVDNQHGFRQKHSTETQLLSTIHDISTALKVSVKENEVTTEKNSSRASIFATKASYTSN